ncbi:biosynthetic-type acetolactate synthase large subunit [Solitalea canadensis]|uniref:Acetolactate synthase n=1 Tax=Solitalea canadensis (strain ATCC 29591 / DSM 3403 / JCM 21819 / LMG 8368 / NBRC 15130 / NCIMB 12057 / USAM 9D) TaxID=929556 RepID=H8KQS2_SOLCM|nr:biosynthetic-type acetolactate synthase large subunit [Solitalea canadensis]AFD06943.1 acetolactate synthase, large subunit, biosynthetic type [Solitalea canadensis DSM 3403]
MSTTVQNDTQKVATKAAARQINGSEALMMALVAEGVDTIFGYPGGAIMPVYDALYDYREKLNHILVRHEQGAGHAAEGYARISGKVGVCLVTSGPGATNLITPIADAMMDSVPMVCIVGQVAKSLLGTDAFQEADVIGMTMPITKWNYQVTTADEIPEIISKAFYIARSGRPGPVLIDVTKNAQFELLSSEFRNVKCNSVRGYRPKSNYTYEQAEKAAELINSSQKPFLFIGQGVLISKAEQEIREFVEKSGIPVASTLHGLSAFPVAHPQYVGMLGMHGNYGANLLTNQADVIIAIGMRFDDRVTGDLSRYAKQAKVIHIEVDPAEIDKNVKTAVSINADAKEALQVLLPLISKREHKEWLERFKDCDRQEYEKVVQHEVYPTEGGMKMGEVINKLSEKTKGEAAIVADVGQHQMMAARYYKFARTNSFISSGGLGTMGFALPAAFGAKVATPEREVVAIIGDGCFQMTIQELGTIAQSKLPVKIIILNNNFLGMVRQWQEMFFDNRYSFVELQNPDFITIGKGFGIEGKKITERAELNGAIDEMLAFDGPFLLEVVVEKEVNVFPMVATGASVDEVRLE